MYHYCAIGETARSGYQRDDMPDPLHALDALVQGRADIAKALAGAVREAVARNDTAHDAFCGCIDWHSAVHGTWALMAYARMTGDTSSMMRCWRRRCGRRSSPPSATLLRARPDFEMPYGRAWFLRLAREHALYAGHRRAAGRWPRTCWPRCWPIWAGSAAGPAARQLPERLLGADQHARLRHLVGQRCSAGDHPRLGRGAFPRRMSGGCDYALETGHFMAVRHQLGVAGEQGPAARGFDRWAGRSSLAPACRSPVTQPVNWHHHGLNFSRAWGLWALSAATGSAEAKAGLPRCLRRAFPRDL